MRHSAASCPISRKFGSTPLAVASISTTNSSSDSFSLKILTALIGSPTYLPSLNSTVFTSPPFRIRRHGMILGLNISKLGEVLQEASSVVVTLFRMELYAVDVACAHYTAEGCSIFGERQRVSRPIAIEVV